MTRRQLIVLAAGLLVAASLTAFLVLRNKPADAAGGWSVSFRTRATAVAPLANPPVADYAPVRWITTDPSIADWRVTATVGADGYAAIAVNVRDSAGVLVGDLVPGVKVNVIDGAWHQVTVKAEAASDGVHVTLTVDSVGATAIAPHSLAAPQHLTTPAEQPTNIASHEVTDLRVV